MFQKCFRNEQRKVQEAAGKTEGSRGNFRWSRGKMEVRSNNSELEKTRRKEPTVKAGWFKGVSEMIKEKGKRQLARQRALETLLMITGVLRNTEGRVNC